MHTWYKWHDLSEHILQFHYIATVEGYNDSEFYIHYPCVEDMPHRVIYDDRWRDRYLVVYVEFDERVVDAPPAQTNLSPFSVSNKNHLGGYTPALSHAQYILPYLVSPKWKREYTLIAHRRAGLKPWLKSNLEKPAVFIESPDFIYITTDDIDDYTLLKIKVDPKIWEPFY